MGASPPENREPRDAELLRELVARERELETTLIAAGAEAERILEHAKVEAERLLAAAQEEWTSRSEEVLRTRIQEAEARSRDTIGALLALRARLEALEEDRLEEMARALLTEIFPELGSGDADRGPAGR